LVAETRIVHHLLDVAEIVGEATITIAGNRTTRKCPAVLAAGKLRSTAPAALTGLGTCAGEFARLGARDLLTWLCCPALTAKSAATRLSVAPALGDLIALSGLCAVSLLFARLAIGLAATAIGP